jgi:7-keto-8-aminopelargonate synthetase-like enzyme
LFCTLKNKMINEAPGIDFKSKHEQNLETVNKIFINSKQLGVTHLVTEDEAFDGQHILIEGKELINFGSCSYLGLELDQRLKNAGKEAIDKFGLQFSSSRAYVSIGLYKEIEELFEQMFGRPVILAPTVSLGHLASIPVLVGDHDAVIVDVQAHASVQQAVDMLKLRKIHVELIRHNRMDVLEEKVIELSKTHKKVWFMCDGVYSMYGDLLPVKKLVALMNKYEQLHAYVDDAHGMSWTGPCGTGHVMSELNGKFHERLYLVCGLAKSFGTAGGLLIFPNRDIQQLVRNCGRTLIFSGPMQPAVLGASVASAHIHMSNEIYTLQSKLRKKIKYFISKANEYELPLIEPCISPINFIGVGKPETGYMMVRTLIKMGCYTNLSVFPSVPYKNTGLRITLTNHITEENIDKLLLTIASELPNALRLSNSSFENILKAFRLKQPVPQEREMAAA